MLLNLINEFKAGFENRKWNYPNRKWNYFSYFLTSNQKLFYKMFLTFNNKFETVFFKGNGNIQKWIRIFYPTPWPLIKKLFLQNISNFYQWAQNLFWKQEIELSKQEMELCLLLLSLQAKNFFYKMFLTFTIKLKTVFKNRKWNYPNRIWNYFSSFLTSNQKPSFMSLCQKSL